LKVLDSDALRAVVAVIVGTRPGIIKFSPVVRALEAADVKFVIIHTGQHYSPNMDAAFFTDLRLPAPAHGNPRVREAKLHGEQTAEMIRGVEQALVVERPRVVIVGGDANTNLAGALAARKLGLTLAHMEAGLRSNDWRMPEEHNRVMIDHISELLFPPTESAAENLRRDNVHGRIWVVGNTIVDALEQNLELARQAPWPLAQLAEAQPYAVATMHREENVDSRDRLGRLIELLLDVRSALQIPIVFPVHPRTRDRISVAGFDRVLATDPEIHPVDPVGYLAFLRLLSSATVILTDSGGIQEEACVLHVPCITLRDNTERPETVAVGANVVTGLDVSAAVAAAHAALDRPRDWPNPFGDGCAGERIVHIVREQCGV
jgi:UDP-N-acetylglucosamine 2-epimerase (non-hydrolysing)